MPKRRAASAKPASLTAAQREATIERLLDQIDAILESEDRERASSLLEDLWPLRRAVPEVLVARVIAGRARVPAFAFELLGGLAGARTAALLRRIAATESVPDLVRFGARRRAGWPERGEKKRRLAFLDTLSDADGTLLQAASEAGSFWPLDAEILEEVVAYLAMMPVERRRALTSRVAAEIGPAALWLLRALVHDADVTTRRLALDGLVKLRQPAALPAIERLERTTPDMELRREAAAAGQRLRLQPVNGQGTVEPLVLPPLDRAFASMIDGVGTQALIVVRRWAEGAFLFASFLFQDSWGIKSVLGSGRAPADVVAETLEEMGDEGIAFVEVDLGAVRGTLARAVAVNAASGQPLPPTFELWEPLLHESYPPPPDEPAATVELDDAPYIGRVDLLRAGARLAEHPFFETWMFDPESMSVALATASPGAGRGPRRYAALLEQLLTPRTQSLLRDRLRRQAWLLDQQGETAARDKARAVAARLADATPRELTTVPFLSKLAERSVIAFFDPWRIVETRPFVLPSSLLAAFAEERRQNE